ncbi:hypothetical protein AAOGI_06810 [Agarivorans albus]
MLGSMTSLTGGGGLSSSSSSANGDFQGGNTGFSGGQINFAPSGGASGGISPLTWVLIAVVVLYALKTGRI